jgi:hypothetical protein
MPVVRDRELHRFLAARLGTGSQAALKLQLKKSLEATQLRAETRRDS